MTAMAMNAWYNNELENYIAPSDNYTTEVTDFSNFENWGHFTNIVWASSTKVGCWSNTCPASSSFCGGATFCWVVMCKYDGKFLYFPFFQGFSANTIIAEGDVTPIYQENVL